jgi:hypothetical protein
MLAIINAHDRCHGRYQKLRWGIPFSWDGIREYNFTGAVEISADKIHHHLIRRDRQTVGQSVVAVPKSKDNL